MLAEIHTHIYCFDDLIRFFNTLLSETCEKVSEGFGREKGVGSESMFQSDFDDSSVFLILAILLLKKHY